MMFRCSGGDLNKLELSTYVAVSWTLLCFVQLKTSKLRRIQTHRSQVCASFKTPYNNAIFSLQYSLPLVINHSITTAVQSNSLTVCSSHPHGLFDSSFNKSELVIQTCFIECLRVVWLIFRLSILDVISLFGTAYLSCCGMSTSEIYAISFGKSSALIQFSFILISCAWSLLE